MIDGPTLAAWAAKQLALWALGILTVGVVIGIAVSLLF